MRNSFATLGFLLCISQSGCGDAAQPVKPDSGADLWIAADASTAPDSTTSDGNILKLIDSTVMPDQVGMDLGSADSHPTVDTGVPDTPPSLCGNKKLDPGESCDDGVTPHCTTYHDGGDGVCVPPGTCSSGYVLDSSGNCVKSSTGLTVPCKQGPGWTLFRFHYGGGGTSPSIDVWDASCSYSYTPNSACNVYAVYPGFGTVSYTSQGYPILTTSEYLRVRFSVAGLSFSKAAVYVQARSYATASSTYFQVWSPLYGGLVAGPVDNDWVYDWYGLDWTGYLQPTDKPSLTAIQIYADKGSGKLAVKAVELCVQ